MITKKHLLLLVILPILLLSLTTINVPVQSAFPPPYVKMYVKKVPLPFVDPGLKFNLRVDIEVKGITDNSAQGIVGWGLYIQVDPAVLKLVNAMGATPSYFLYNFSADYGYPSPGLLANLDPATGYGDISEQISPTPSGGAGEGTSTTFPKLLVIKMESLTNTTGCAVDIFGCEYMTPDGSWHPVDIIEDSYYGVPPSVQSEVTGTYSPTGDPTGTTWHELQPNYCDTWTLVTWMDNGDGDLSASDQIVMENASGWTYPYHVDAVTTTIHWTFKSPDTGTADAEPDESFPERLADIMKDPIGSYWHQIYPDYCRQFKITSWDDNSGEPDTDPNGVFDASDQFDFIYEDDANTTHWAHLDKVTTDIIISQKGPPEPPPVPEFPFGVVLMIAIAPAIPILYLWRSRKKVVAK